MFQDKLLICTQCGNDFVFTRRQQKMAEDSSSTVEDPTLCPVCQVQQVRMARWAAKTIAQENDASEDKSDASPSTTSPSDSPANKNQEQPAIFVAGETYTGKVKWFNRRKGFGFIEREDGAQIFVHHSGLADKRNKNLKRGKSVHFVIEENAKGAQATQVRVVKKDASPASEVKEDASPASKVGEAVE